MIGVETYPALGRSGVLQRPERGRSAIFLSRSRAPARVGPRVTLLPRRLNLFRLQIVASRSPGAGVRHGGPSRAVAARAAVVSPCRTAPHRGNDAASLRRSPTSSSSSPHPLRLRDRGVHLFAGSILATGGRLPRGAHPVRDPDLEGWVDLMNASLAATGWAWIYYVSFVVLAVSCRQPVHRNLDQQPRGGEARRAGPRGRADERWPCASRIRQQLRQSNRRFAPRMMSGCAPAG